MLATLIKKQISEIFRSYLYDQKKNKKRSKSAIVMYFVMFALLMVGVLGGIFGFLSFKICRPLYDAGMGWLYFTLMGLLSVFLGAFGSVFNTFSGLYLSKDNDFLLSLPIPVNYILISRLMSVYIMGLMYSATVIIPAAIVYWVSVPFSIAAVVGSVILTVLISVIVMILSCVLGWVVAKISLKLKNKSFVTVAAALLFIGVYYFFYFKAQSLIQDLVANAVIYGTKIKGAAYPIYLFGRIGEGEPVAIIIFTVAVAVIFALMWIVLSKSFIGIATSTGKTEKKIYKRTVTRQKSTDASLLSKEFARFTSSPNYMLNCGLGILFMIAIGVALLIKGGYIAELLGDVFSEQKGIISIFLCTVLIMVSSMNDTAAPSVSLEGKNLWLVQSLPVKPWQVLRAKLNMQIILSSVPAVFALICAAFTLNIRPAEMIMSAVFTLLNVVMTALFGLTIGLKMPNLTWSNEIVPIKQSASVAISLIAGWVFSVAFIVIYFILGYRMRTVNYIGIFAMAEAIISALLFLWLKRVGTREFSEL